MAPDPRSFEEALKDLSPEELNALQERYKRDWDQLVATSRLSLPFPIRLPIATTAAFLGGGFLGLNYGARKANLLYRAENAHRLPTTQKGWYFYHKTKNYKVAWGGIKEAGKMGSKLSFWVASYFALENVLDEFWDRTDFSNSVVASVVVAGGFSMWNRFDMTTSVRTAKKGLGFGLAFGLTQDLLFYLRGRPLWYVDMISGRRRLQELPAEST